MFEVDTNKLLNLLLEHKMTIRSLSQRAGVSYEAVWRLFNGKSRAGIPVIAKLAEALNLPPRSLMLNQSQSTVSTNGDKH